MAKGEKILKRIPLKKIITIVVVIALAGGGVYALKNYNDKKKAAANTNVITTHMVEKGDVSLMITGSSTIEPYDRREIVAKVSGEITYSPFEEGQTVNEGDILYQFDTTDLEFSLKRLELTEDTSRRNYENSLDDKEKLNIKTTASGVISNLNIKTGDDVKAGEKIADISDTLYLEVVLPFIRTEADNISVGDSAVVSSSAHMSNVPGTVTHKSATSHAGADGSTLVDVTISFKNEGAIGPGLTVGGAVGNYISPGSGVIEVSDSGYAMSDVEGTVANVYYSNGDYVEKGTIIATITSDTITDMIDTNQSNYESSSLSVEETRNSFEDYTNTAPISGTIIEKNKNVGDTIEKMGTVTEPLMVIADISKLKFDLEVDELDVSRVMVGQTVEITCDALPGEEFIGEIVNISVEGTSQNGVTSYAAEVIIAEPGNLRPSMNIDASVLVESSEDTLIIPSEDLKTVGNVYYVYKKSDGTENQSLNELDEATRKRIPRAPEGFEAVVVTVGVVGNDYAEILSGLSENDEIYAQIGAGDPNVQTDGIQMGNMSGGMSSGGFSHPGGGM